MEYNIHQILLAYIKYVHEIKYKFIYINISTNQHGGKYNCIETHTTN